MRRSPFRLMREDRARTRAYNRWKNERDGVMKAISLWQPWASLIAIGTKTMETRDWAPPREYLGGRIAIHAAKRPVCFPPDIADDLHEAFGFCALNHRLPRGAIV